MKIEEEKVCVSSPSISYKSVKAHFYLFGLIWTIAVFKSQDIINEFSLGNILSDRTKRPSKTALIKE